MGNAYSAIFLRFCKEPKAQSNLLKAISRLFEADGMPDAPKAPLFAKALRVFHAVFEAGLVSKEIFVAWHNKNPSAPLCRQVAAFIQWCSEPDEDADEVADDDENDAIIFDAAAAHENRPATGTSTAAPAAAGGEAN